MVRAAPAPPRPGHSLPELIVAVTFLGAALVGVGASSVLGARWAGKAVERQEALRRAAAVLDSLAFHGAAGTEVWVEGPWRLRWTATGARITVRVERVDGPVLARLTGRAPGSVPVLGVDTAAQRASP